MIYHPDIPSQLGPLVGRELKSTERILWVGQPSALSAAISSIPLILFGIPWTGFSLVWTGAAFGAVSSGGPWWSYVFPLWGVPFILVGLGMLSAPFLAVWGAKRSLYLITDTRALMISGVRTKTIKSLEAERFTNIFRREKPNGRGDLVLDEFTVRDSEGDRVRNEFAFLGIPEVKRVEEIARSLRKVR